MWEGCTEQLGPSMRRSQRQKRWWKFALTTICSGSGCISPAGKQRLKYSHLDSNPNTKEKASDWAKSWWSPFIPAGCVQVAQSRSYQQTEQANENFPPAAHMCGWVDFTELALCHQQSLGFPHETPLCPSPNRKEPQQPLSASCLCHQALHSHPSPVTCFLLPYCRAELQVGGGHC